MIGETFRSRYFVGWLAVSVPLFVLTVAAVHFGTQAAGVSQPFTVAVAVGVGSVFGDLTDPVLEQFVDADAGDTEPDEEVTA